MDDPLDQLDALDWDESPSENPSKNQSEENLCQGQQQQQDNLTNQENFIQDLQ
jgi:hypothetical protein